MIFHNSISLPQGKIDDEQGPREETLKSPAPEPRPPPSPEQAVLPPKRPRITGSVPKRSWQRANLRRVRNWGENRWVFSMLVGDIPTPLKNMKVNWDDEIPN